MKKQKLRVGMERTGSSQRQMQDNRERAESGKMEVCCSETKFECQWLQNIDTING